MDVARWLDDHLPDPDSDGGAALGELTEGLLVELERVAADAVGLLDERVAGTPTLRLPKSRLAALGRCERSAVAVAEDASPSEVVSRPMLIGVAHDRFVIHQLHAGRVREPVEDLREMLLAEGEWALLDALDQLEDADPDGARAMLEPIASTVATAWSGFDPSWLPRTQSRATLLLASGRVVSTGVVDVELGGAGTGRPHVVVEVKSSEPGSDHLSEVAHYALLLTVRDRAAPAAVARWYPGTAPAVVPVNAGLLESAARRLADGIATWAELMSGRAPVERPGPWCRWCPDASVCPSAAADREAVSTA